MVFNILIKFLSGNLDTLYETFVDNKHKTLKKMEKKQIVGEDQKLNIFLAKETLISKLRYNNEPI